MSTTGNISFTVSGGSAGAVTIVGASGSGGTIQDGAYQINVDLDNSGTTVSVVTPSGAAGHSSIRSSASADA